MQPPRDSSNPRRLASGRRRRPRLVVLYMDDWVVAVDKPAGVLSSTGRGEALTVLQLLAENRSMAEGPELRLVHRLDRGASGVLLVARGGESQRRLTAAFAHRQVQKSYLAMASGWVPADGQIDLPLLVDRERRKVKVDRRAGKPSLTRYTIVERLPGNTLLECYALTGRLHQIRAHLSAIGHPLTVDARYGGGRALYLSEYKPDYRPNRSGNERPLIQRLTLHAARITFPHPDGTGPVTIDAPLPKDFRATLAQLRRLRGQSSESPRPRQP